MTSQPTAADVANTQPAELKMNYNTALFLDSLTVGPNQVNKVDGQLIQSHNKKIAVKATDMFLEACY